MKFAEDTHHNIPDWESHNDFISHNKHYYSAEHRITHCHGSEFNGKGDDDLIRFGHKGTPGQVVHPIELGFYRFWEERGGIKGSLIPESNEHIDQFMEKYDPNSDNAKSIIFRN